MLFLLVYSSPNYNHESQHISKCLISKLDTVASQIRYESIDFALVRELNLPLEVELDAEADLEPSREEEARRRFGSDEGDGDRECDGDSNRE